MGMLIGLTRPVWTVLAASLLGSAAGSALAQEAGTNDRPEEDIIVLAKRGMMELSVEGAKLPIPLKEVPQSIAIIDRALLDSQNVVELEDALRNAAGVTPGGYFEGFDYYRIRGFEAQGNTYIDGLRADQTFWVQEELFGMESVEVLKGPPSALFGQAPAGGLVNLVSKRPVQDDFVFAQSSIGSYDYFDAGLDANVQVGSRVAVRVNALYRERGSFVDDVDVSHRYFIAPTVTFFLGDRTQLTLLSQFIDEKNGVAQPLIAEGTVLPNPNGRLRRSLSIGEPDFGSVSKIDRQQVGYELKHEFSDALSFRSIGRAGWIDVDFHSIYALGIDRSGEGDYRTLDRFARKQSVDAKSIAVDNNLIAKFSTGGITHTLILGQEYYSFDQLQAFGPFRVIAPLDLFDPVYGSPIADFDLRPPRKTEDNRFGLYVQDHLKITDRLSVLVGGRYDWAKADGDKETRFTPRVGLTYALTDDLSAFLSYAESFTPQLSYLDAQDNPLPPELGVSYEAGLKAALFGDRITGTVAIYELTRQNVATSDDDFGPFSGIYRATGEQRSRGFEIDGVFRITPTWEVVGSYSYIDAEVTKDIDYVIGQRTANVPKHMINLWTKYIVPSGPLEGFGANAGIRYQGKQSGGLVDVFDPDLAFDLPSFTIVDAGLSYERAGFRLHANVANLFDKRYFPASTGRDYVMPGMPRTYRLTAGYRF